MQRGGWPKVKIKGETEKQHSSHLRKIGACLHQLLKLEEREFVVDSGASMHMMSKKDLNSAEMDTLTKSCSPTMVITANGEVQTHEEATVYVEEFDIFFTMKVLEDTPAVFSLGNLCDEHGYSLRKDQRSKTTCKNIDYSVIRKTSYQSWFLVYQRVLPQACLLHHS